MQCSVVCVVVYDDSISVEIVRVTMNLKKLSGGGGDDDLQTYIRNTLCHFYIGCCEVIVTITIVTRGKENDSQNVVLGLVTEYTGSTCVVLIRVWTC